MLPARTPLASALLFAMVSPIAAHATPDDAGDGGQRKATQLDGVDVHASQVESVSNKFTAPLLDTPKSVSVIPQSVIEQTAAVTLLDALRTVPGITFGAGEGGNPTGDRPFIRGFDSQSDIYVDGIRDAGSQTREVFAIEQIEVIKGPSSAYSGRGSAGGHISLVSKTAKLDDFVAGSIGLGTDNYRRATVDANAVIGDGIAARLNLMKHDADIAGRDEVNNSRWGIAPSIAWGLNGPTQASISHYHMETDDLPDAGGFAYNNPFSSGANLGKNGDGSPIVPNRNAFYGLVDRDFQQTRADITTLNLSHDFGGATLRNIARYGRTRNDYLWTQPDDSKGNPNLYGTVWRRTNARATTTDSLVNQTSLSGTLATGTLQHSYNAGIEYSDEDTQRGSYAIGTVNGLNGTFNPVTGSQSCPTTGAATGYNCTDLANPTPHDPWAAGHHVTRTDPALDIRQKTRTRSAYLFDTVEFNPQWMLNLGARFDDYATRQSNPVTAVTLRNDSTFWNGQAGLVFKPLRNGSIYLSWGTSSTPVGMDGGDGADGISAAVQDLTPQRSRNLELGTKWDLADGRLSLTGAVFATEMSNARVTSDAGTTQNAGRKKVTGAEIGFSGTIAAGWQVFGGYTYLDAVVEDNGFALVDGVYAPSPFNGNAFPNTARHSASLWSTWTPAFAPGLSLGAGANYVDKVYGNVANTKWIPAYTRFDAMVAYEFSKQYGLQLNVQNLTDKTYFTKAYASHYAAIAPGRSATLAFNFKF
ncbi:TonB-dependent siderophore receptor [Stenotrophomonas sp. YIM B06876]|uniref:TonB-dependent receptor n=1 Tax=Stenotrophomonas sp. YIM B06876 TaxID=3060211 RepID=UPI002739C457|nr:TonB-dependent siderophore receptor [Stenotrophomonas sp. YIM B06876]